MFEFYTYFSYAVSKFLWSLRFNASEIHKVQSLELF